MVLSLFIFNVNAADSCEICLVSENNNWCYGGDAKEGVCFSSLYSSTCDALGGDLIYSVDKCNLAKKLTVDLLENSTNVPEWEIGTYWIILSESGDNKLFSYVENITNYKGVESYKVKSYSYNHVFVSNPFEIFVTYLSKENLEILGMEIYDQDNDTWILEQYENTHFKTLDFPLYVGKNWLSEEIFYENDVVSFNVTYTVTSLNYDYYLGETFFTIESTVEGDNFFEFRYYVANNDFPGTNPIETYAEIDQVNDYKIIGYGVLNSSLEDFDQNDIPDLVGFYGFELYPFNSNKIIGDPDAPITIEFFTEFQEPFSARWYMESFPKLSEQMDFGVFNIKFRHFPLSFHKNALNASFAAECAASFGKFPEYISSLYLNQDSLTYSDLLDYALDVGISVSEFSECFTDPFIANEVNEDITEGISRNVIGLPTFFIGDDVIRGSQPSSVFESSLKKELDNVINFGDVTGDGSISALDSAHVLKYLEGTIELDTIQRLSADVDGDFIITSNDAQMILSYVVGNIDRFPAEYINPVFEVNQIEDYGIDLDNDGIFDLLAINVSVNSLFSNDYGIYFDLVNEDGDFIEYLGGREIELDVGVNTFTLYFDGFDIFQTGKSGNFKLKNLRLRDGDIYFTIKELYETNFYYYFNFERPGAVFTGEYLPRVFDEDHDGFYDFFIVKMGINVTESGEYSIEGFLRGSNEIIFYPMKPSQDIIIPIDPIDLPTIPMFGFGKKVYSDHLTVYLDEGYHELDLNFSGLEIYTSKLNNLRFSDVIIREVRDDLGTFNSRVVDEDEVDYFINYSYSDFEHPGLEMGNITDYGVDTNDNGLSDYLRIDLPVLVSESGYYEFNAKLLDLRGSSEFEAYLTEGTHIISLDFDGEQIRNLELSGIFDVNIEVDQDGIEIYGSLYRTNNYSANFFERPSVELDGEIFDYGVDTDGDGLYNYLRVAVPVIIRKNGTYRTEGDLDNMYFHDLDEEIYLTTEDDYVFFDFNGEEIYNNKISGNYIVEDLQLHSKNTSLRVRILENYPNGKYFTNFYEHTNFQHSVELVSGKVSKKSSNKKDSSSDLNVVVYSNDGQFNEEDLGDDFFNQGIIVTYPEQKNNLDGELYFKLIWLFI